MNRTRPLIDRSVIHSWRRMRLAGVKILSIAPAYVLTRTQASNHSDETLGWRPYGRCASVWFALQR